ncbi:hypothetical protein A2U01_0071578, partial [Trifolium medium]|nr:hypothetical protein [Trifolium medium]
TKASASARREKAAQNPPKKRSWKAPAQLDAAEDEDTEMEIQGDDVVRDMEEEEMVREGDEGPSKVRRPTWVNPYKGQPEPEVFPGGPSDKM